MKRENLLRNLIYLFGLVFVVAMLAACGADYSDGDWDDDNGADWAEENGAEDLPEADDGGDVWDEEEDEAADEDWDDEEEMDGYWAAEVAEAEFDEDDGDVARRTRRDEAEEGGVLGGIPILLPADSGRQLIYTVEFNIDTLEFNRAFRMLLDVTGELEGYSERVTEHGRSLRNPDMERHANLSLRIPNENLMDFVTFIDDNVDIFNREFFDKELEDFTFEYERAADEIEDLREEEQRILDELASDGDEEPDATQEDLAEVRDQIRDLEEENIATQHDVDYSNVSIRLSEVIFYVEEPYEPEEIEEPDPFGYRLRNTINSSIGGLVSVLQDLLLFIIVILPWLFFIALFVVPIIFIVRRYRRNFADSGPHGPTGPSGPNGSGGSNEPRDSNGSGGSNKPRD